MMRVLFLSLLVTLSSGSVFAANNAWMRVCRIDQGVYMDLQNGSDEYVMCFFDNAALGAEAFFKFKTKAGGTLALQAYKAGGAESCEAVGAQTVVGSDTDNRSYQLCKFNDGSLIQTYSLQAGPGAAVNAKLDQAISATY